MADRAARLSDAEWKSLRVIVQGSAQPRKGHLAVQYFARLLGEAGEGAGCLSQRLRVDAAGGEQAGLLGGAEVAEGLLAELRRVRRQPGQRRDAEEGADLLAEGLVLLAGERHLDLVPPRVPRQRQLQRPPGAGRRPPKRLAQPGAVVAEAQFGSTFFLDPKILLSLLMWAMYMLLLFTRWNSGWRGRRAAFLSTFAFLVAVVAWDIPVLPV